MKFVMQRKFTLRTRLGHCVSFERGVPTHVPPLLHREAIAAGAVPEDQAILTQFEAQDEVVRRDPVMNPELRDKTIVNALKTMRERNLRGYFNAQGLPSLKQLEILCGFEVDKHERDRLWAIIVQEPDTGDAEATS